MDGLNRQLQNRLLVLRQSQSVLGTVTEAQKTSTVYEQVQSGLAIQEPVQNVFANLGQSGLAIHEPVQSVFVQQRWHIAFIDAFEASRDSFMYWTYRCLDSATRVARTLFRDAWRWVQFGQIPAEAPQAENSAPPLHLVANTVPGRAPPLRSWLFRRERRIGDPDRTWAAGVA